ncbi:hypothetical protein [Microbispora sp. NPDC046933]|uniref:hypothetical protein n=1 Tax=Microbispora sp. NPDC046933 TaxID=3155618 RepID=UPI0033C9438E
MGLSGSVAASATSAKSAPAAHAATSPQGGGEKDKTPIPYPRLDSANVVTAFTIGGSSVAPTDSTTFTGSARRGRVFVNDGTGWADLTSVFSPGYLYDVTLAPAPSTKFALTNNVLTRLDTSGIPVGLLRVTVRKADGSLFYSDCRVSDTSGASTLPLTASRCTAPTRL